MPEVSNTPVEFGNHGVSDIQRRATLAFSNACRVIFQTAPDAYRVDIKPRRDGQAGHHPYITFRLIAESECALSDQLDNPESIYQNCADMKLLNQEVLRVILLDTRYRHISTIEISKGTVNESLAHPGDRKILRSNLAKVGKAPVLARRCQSPSLSSASLFWMVKEQSTVMTAFWALGLLTGRSTLSWRNEK